jgi:hypothetical protein
MLSDTREIMVLDCDGRLPQYLHATKIRVLRKPDRKVLRKSKNLFLTCLATQLPEIGSLVLDFTHRLRALFVYQDVAASFLIPLMRRAGLRASTVILFHTGWDLPTRVLRAWQLGAEDRLIADASTSNNTLFVLSCSMKEHAIPFDAFEALKALPARERDQFQIADDGSYLHWPSSDVHVDLDALRYATDPGWRKKVDLDRTTRDARFGAAVASLRKRHRLNQTDIQGVSERQIRRIEQGSRPRVRTLELMAKGHGLTLEAYLSMIAKQMADRSLMKASDKG